MAVLRSVEKALGFKELNDFLIQAPEIEVPIEGSFETRLASNKKIKGVIMHGIEENQFDECYSETASLYLVRYLPEMSPETLSERLEADGFECADPFSTIALHSFCDIQEILASGAQWKNRNNEWVKMIFPMIADEKKAMYLYKSTDHWPGHGWWFICTKK